MNPVKITLSGGREVNIYPVPPYVTNLALSKFRDPAIPMRPVNPEVDPIGQELPDPTNPKYLEELAAVRQKRGEAYVDVRLLYGLLDEKLPEDWPTQDDRDRWDALGINPEIPDKKEGKRLAYIKFNVLQSDSDLTMIMDTIDTLQTLDSQAVNDLVESFRNKRKGDATS